MPSRTLERRKPVSYLPYPPHETHRAEQHYASVAEGLDRLIDGCRQLAADGAERARRLDLIGSHLGNAAASNGGQPITAAEHIGTLANLLAVAVDRLAAQDGAQ